MYPDTPGHAAGSQTSKAAAEQLTSKTFLQEKILFFASSQAGNGTTVDEAKQFCETAARRLYDRSTIAARFLELEVDGKLTRSIETRPTPRKRQASVYYLAGKVPADVVIAVPSSRRKIDNGPARKLAERLVAAVRRGKDVAQEDGSILLRVAPYDIEMIEEQAKAAGI